PPPRLLVRLGPRARHLRPALLPLGAALLPAHARAGPRLQATLARQLVPLRATVLANEQVVDGGCWRCGTAVELRELDQWYLRITAYAEQLLGDLDRLEGWPERVVAMQRNWIGRSEGAEIRFPLDGRDGEVAVFTTRPDTLFGVTFMSLAPEHPLSGTLAAGTPHEASVAAFVARMRARGRSERAVGKGGIATGAFCRHPLTGARP